MKYDLKWVHVEYGSDRTEYYSKATSALAFALGVRPSRLIVQNNVRADCDIAALRGSNRLREFSGWNEGIAAVEHREPLSESWWLLSNDTFAHHRFFWGSLASRFSFAFRKNRHRKMPVMIGDVLPGSMFPQGGDARYISTYFFLINGPMMSLLKGDLIGDAPLHWIARSPDLSLTSDSCPQSVALFLSAHLTRPGSHTSWRGAGHLNAHNIHSLRFKATATLLEHWLSLRARNLGAHFIPVIDRSGTNLWRLIRSLEARLTAK